MEVNEIADRLTLIERKLERIWSRVEEIAGRMSNHLGEGVSTTYLRNGNLIYVNSNDFGPPANFLDGGDYEPDNLQVLLSFVTDETVFLDIGANLGFFSLVIGDRMRQAGKVIAFEPQPQVVELFERSIHHNGLRNIVTVHPLALSNAPATLRLLLPKGHKGGATLNAHQRMDPERFEAITVDARRLDDVVGGDFACDLVKIDVEGFELHVLEGMTGVVGRSPRIKILLEKLEIDVGVEKGLAAYFKAYGMELFGVAGPKLVGPLDLAGLRAWSGYLLAIRPELLDERDRRRFSVYPRHMLGASSRLANGRLLAEGPGLMAHGPYWSLTRGSWRLTVRGEIRGEVTCQVTERFGLPVATSSIIGPDLTADFVIAHDLNKFECVFRGAAGAKIAIDRLDWQMIG